MTANADEFSCGIDIGSTTVKLVLLPRFKGKLSLEPCSSAYKRHNAKIADTLLSILGDLRSVVGIRPLHVSITGSAGMGFSERLGFTFVQEVVASAEAAQKLYPSARMVCDIGGEDSKLILFDDCGRPDYRMNGACAGGTGAYIDQMATLLDCQVDDLDDLASNHHQIHPIASRCGVFAKSDIQNLLSQGIPHSDLAASLLRSVALQVANSLVRGATPKPPLLMIGGPLTFISNLRRALAAALGVDEEQTIVPRHAQLFPAMGAALSAPDGVEISLENLIGAAKAESGRTAVPIFGDVPLFESPAVRAQWDKLRFTKVPRISLTELDQRPCFIGVDSGSTTTKMVLVDEAGRLALSWYEAHMGNHVVAVAKGLNFIYDTLANANVHAIVSATAATGYGEDLVRTAFDFDIGVVETLAHARAAQQVEPEASFVLDIGGQDMKAVYIERGAIRNIEVNESCSSGCGSFLQSFAKVMGLSIEEFAEIACSATSPCDLGSRCTVFMNSLVKQAFRQNCTLADIAAGLSYSVVHNCLNKVLKVRDSALLGEKIVVQGGAFLNAAVQRAFEIVVGRPVVCPDIAGLMGAYGSALCARDTFIDTSDRARPGYDLERAASVHEVGRRKLLCKGCTNGCTIDRIDFGDRQYFYSGNRCERKFSNAGQQKRRGYNAIEDSERVLFDRPLKPLGPSRGKIGIPRVLNIFDHFPFWATLFVDLGYEVVVSEKSSTELCDGAVGTVMSDSICFPAKLVHGHIKNLVDAKVDRIVFPSVVYDRLVYGARNSYNCPIVTGYPDVIRSALNPESYGIPFHVPVISLRDRSLLRKGVWSALGPLGVLRREFIRAFKAAVTAQQDFIRQQESATEAVIAAAARAGRRVVMLLGRPYHIDRLINHDVPDMLADSGVDVIGCNYAPDAGTLDGSWFLTQWAFPNRILNACRFGTKYQNIEFVQLNSFGCGPDAMLVDEVSSILRRTGKNLAVLRVDENSSRGSLRLRVRTFVETSALRCGKAGNLSPRAAPARFMKSDRRRKILAPYFSPAVSLITEDECRRQGYDLEILPPTDKESERWGVKYTNNEICYPALLVIGDVLKALASGRYDREKTAIGITQTGGQCRASNYLGLLQKALLAAGYGDVPVVSVNLAGKHLYEQPGFKLNHLKLVPSAFLSIVVADALAMLEHHFEAIECERGTARVVADTYLRKWLSKSRRSVEFAKALIREAIGSFRSIPRQSRQCLKVGLVGEVYVKYGVFANRNMVRWLVDQKCEVIVPPLVSLFLSGLVNTKVKAEVNVEKYGWRSLGAAAALPAVERLLDDINGEFKGFPGYMRFSRPTELAQAASGAIGLCNQAGEGWLLAGEIVELGHAGIDRIVCLQPFGCIANQIVAKGIESRLRKQNPALNLLYLDLDQSSSEANLFNRLHFLLKDATATDAAVSPARTDRHEDEQRPDFAGPYGSPVRTQVAAVVGIG